MLISLDLLEESTKRFESIEDRDLRELTESKNKKLLEESAMPMDSKAIVAGNIIGNSENMDKRKEMLSKLSLEPLESAFERAIGKNDSLFSNFVELIDYSKRKVGRIVIKHGGSSMGFATGFLVSDSLLLTNWYVFKTIEEVGDSEIQFNYELDIIGKPKRFISFKFDPQKFFYSDDKLDYCFIAVQPFDTECKEKLADIGYIYLDPTMGKLGNVDQEAMNIIHHPNGEFKQLSIRENIFKNITPTSIWYKTDTAPGSSGSPVFNDQWQIVALHHMGVPKKDKDDNYLDKKGNIIPLEDGSIDASKISWEANEGIRISVILKDIFLKFPNDILIDGLKRKPSSKNEILLSPDSKNNESDKENIKISIPTEFINSVGSVSLNINLNQPVNTIVPKIDNSDNQSGEFEAKKLEQNLDLSACLGYQSDFLKGFKIKMPKPKIFKDVALLEDKKSFELKYFNYSVILCMSRKMPIISAINIDGNLDLRKDDSDRLDIWLRDNRISYDYQLNDDFYSNSGFDRGHMSRREDANWGITPEIAKRNADFTCMHTNACPQVKEINRSSNKGLWGILEKLILEEGAQKESGTLGKISVFNGPIFKKSDPKFKGIQIPLEFYKLVLWLDDNSKLKATAFILSQKNFVSMKEEEALDIDKNQEFLQYQIKISDLEKLTQIDFKSISKFDTYVGSKQKNIGNKELFQLITN